MLDPLLVERLQNHVPGAVGGVAGALDRALAEVPSVPTEPALIHATIGGAIEGQTHVLELENRIDSFASQYLGRVLVDEIVTALDRVEHVPLPMVFLDVAEGRADAALSRAGVRPRWVELADHRDVGFAGHLNSRHQARAAGADDDRVVAVICHGVPPGTDGGRTACVRGWPVLGHRRYLMVDNGI